MSLIELNYILYCNVFTISGLLYGKDIILLRGFGYLDLGMRQF